MIQNDTSPTRRRWLHLMGGAAASTLAGPLLTACGGGGHAADSSTATPVQPNTPPPSDSSDDARRATAFAAVAGLWQQLAASASAPEARAEAMAAYMATLPAYTDSGAHADAQCAWGRFADGRAHIVSFADVLAPADRVSSSAEPRGRARTLAAPLEVPGAPAARLMHSFGPAYDDGNGIVDDLSSWLRGKGYALRNGAAGDARLTLLRTVQGDGFFYIGTHGGAWGRTERDWQPVPGVPWSVNESPMLYAITSSTTYDAALERTPELADDLANQRLVYYTGANGLYDAAGKPLSSEYYGITAYFVVKYWRFAADAVVVINACSSARTERRWASDFIAAVHHAGAACYAGWTETVNWQGAGTAPRYFVDRLLGANQYSLKESPPQRAFGWDTVLPDMQRRGVDRNPGNSARFVVRPNPAAGHPQALAPSIRQCEVIEVLDELWLHGEFGSRRGRVTLALADLDIVEWTPAKVRCRLPRSGALSVGDVQAFVGPVESNVRSVSQWLVPFETLHVDLNLPALKVRGSGSLRLRADVGACRTLPGQVPVKPVVYAVAARESTYTASASGSVHAPDCVADWGGSATWVVPPDPMSGQLPAFGLSAYVKFDTDNGSVAIAPAAGMYPGTVPPYTEACSGSRFAMPIGRLHGRVPYSVPGGTGEFFQMDAVQTMLSGSQAVVGTFVTRGEDTFTVKTAAATLLAPADAAL